MLGQSVLWCSTKNYGGLTMCKQIINSSVDETEKQLEQKWKNVLESVEKHHSKVRTISWTSA